MPNGTNGKVDAEAEKTTLAQLLEKLLHAHAETMDRTTRGAIRSAIRRLMRSGGGTLAG